MDRLWAAPAGFPHLIAANVLEILAAILAATPEETHQLILQGPRDVTALTDRVVSDALRVIWSGSHLQLSVASLAKLLHITSRSLERRFQDALGRTVREEILRCRLDRAAAIPAVRLRERRAQEPHLGIFAPNVLAPAVWTRRIGLARLEGVAVLHEARDIVAQHLLLG